MQQTDTLAVQHERIVNGSTPQFSNFAAPSGITPEDNKIIQTMNKNKREWKCTIDGIDCRFIEGYAMAEIIREANRRETVIAIVDDDFKKQTFTVMLAGYNSDTAMPTKHVFIHAHKKGYTKYLSLVVVTEEERMRELTDKKYANEWKKRIPRKYY